MAEGKAGRPKVLLRRHVIEIKEDTREWLEERLGDFLKAHYAGKATRSLGEAAKGLLGNPVFMKYLLIALGIGASIGVVKKLGAAAGDASFNIYRGIAVAWGGEEGGEAMDEAWSQTKSSLGQIPVFSQLLAFFGMAPDEKGAYQEAVGTHAEQVAAESRERERIQRERAAVPP